MPPVRVWSIALALAGCSARGGAAAPVRPERAVPAEGRGPLRAGPAGGLAVSETGDPPAPRPLPSEGSARGGLTPNAARHLMVDLINRDRATMGLAAVTLDEGPPTKAGQGHADDMARNGYLGHWGSDGSVPEQRFTEAGGVDMVLENASCFTDEKVRVLDRAPRIERKNVEQAEDMFFHERPPHDGHRRNILRPWHKRVGIGVAQPVATATEIPAPCFAQEFVDSYGSYAPLPRAMNVGDTLHVDGTVLSPATFAGVGLARVEAPKPIAVAELNRRRSYPVPAPYTMYWPPGYETPIPVRVSGGRFHVDVPLSEGGMPGMYEVSVWASVPGGPDLVMVSLRTIQTPAGR
jgi:uncharacterized protein YkwD